MTTKRHNSVCLLTLTRLGAIHEQGMLTFLRHFSWDMKLQTVEIKEQWVSLPQGRDIRGETQTNRKSNKKNHVWWNTTGNVSFPSHLLSSSYEYLHNCRISCSTWTSTSFVTKNAGDRNQESSHKLITCQQQPLLAHPLLSITTKITS